MYLSHCSGATFVHKKVVFITDDQVKIDDLVGKGGELVAKAESVLPLLLRRPRERIVLLFCFFVKNFLCR